MVSRIAVVFSLLGFFFLFPDPDPADACCAVSSFGKPVVNADQSVIIIWDAANKTQHFIRRASFKGDADDFGFLIPSPTQPELSESGNEAFPYLQKLTEPETQTRLRPISFGCSVATMRDAPGLAWSNVTVLEEKTVAGFHAAVLETNSTTALVQWLKQHGYAFSPEVEAWAKPYVEQGWKITALKVAQDKDVIGKSVSAGALRMSFKTDRPLFPYREPEYKGINEALGVKQRLLRIYFLAEARYQGDLTKTQAWSGKVAWSGKLKARERSRIYQLLKLPEASDPMPFWLTEFEDNWSYQLAPADVYFTRAANQDAVKREPIVRYVSSRYPTDVALYAMVAIAFVPALVRWTRMSRDR